MKIVILLVKILNLTLLKERQVCDTDECLFLESYNHDIFLIHISHLPCDIMKLKSSAKLSKDDCVMGERGSRIFCCMSRAYIHKVMHLSK